MSEKLLNDVVYPVVEQVNAGLDPSKALAKDPATALYGPDAKIDSLALVSLIVAVEQKVEEDLGKTIKIVSAEAFSRKRSPFLSLGALAEYVSELVAR